MEKENDYLEAVNELKKQYDTCKADWEGECCPQKEMNGLIKVVKKNY